LVQLEASDLGVSDLGVSDLEVSDLGFSDLETAMVLEFELLVVASAGLRCLALGKRLSGTGLPSRRKEEKSAGPEHDYSEGA
jgi:hypothetical protein